MGHSIRFILLLLLVVSAFIFAEIVPLEIRSVAYAVSLSIKEVLVFLLPFIVFSVVFHSTSLMRGGSTIKTSALLLAMVFLSNSTSVGIAHFLASYVIDVVDDKVISTTENANTLVPAYTTFSLPSIVSCAKALIMGFVCGAALPKIFGDSAVKVSKKLYGTSVFLLEKAFAPLLPIFIVGLTFKMRSDGALDMFVDNYEVMLFVFVPAVLHVLFLFLVGCGGSVRLTAGALKNMFPAAVTGFATMSSLLAMPVTLAAVKKSTNNSPMADIVVPGSVNIHLVGDCFFTVILMMFLASGFGTLESVSVSDYAHFLMYVVLMKFADAAIAGTGLLLMFPILEEYLHFTPVMLSLSTTIYILLDPVLAVLNVLGNGAFSILFVKVHKFLFGDELESSEESK
ncbi:cation:dicarboxylate symporter family transporter [Candidatus Anaplasma sp. TIGMIC]|uniref:cation:dicarboxylate symporter family transporter n=1 Tax=Candidatus Anaplasma sp. TIGMIC TaxID=3020713 RepID=UPI00232B5CD3|nr:cation:dicarboxylase symporter family transporter [Candidatus Anaplasma sp. TIGMIC]MDB1135663.1 cation:dicarboxylase symporter family transporter [Candidatus Anaplasma sp. TIGMIC]